MGQPLFSPMLQLLKSGTSNVLVMLLVLSVELFRKSQQQELDFQNLHVNMISFRPMVPILSLLKVKSGKNIEKSVHPLSLMCDDLNNFRSTSR